MYVVGKDSILVYSVYIYLIRSLPGSSGDGFNAFMLAQMQPFGSASESLLMIGGHLRS